MLRPPKLVFLQGGLPLIALLFIAGCSSGQNANRALDASLAANNLTREKVYPLAGKITVDGMAPELADGERIVVMLIDIAKPEQEPGVVGPYTTVDKSGQFAFRTYEADDGIAPGTYVAIIAKLEAKKKKGLIGPDGFHNLYNDPDRNQKEHAELKIEHQAPGKKNYQFDLQVAGRDSLEPSSKSLTKIVIRGK
jgi:hypothetical protein